MDKSKVMRALLQQLTAHRVDCLSNTLGARAHSLTHSTPTSSWQCNAACVRHWASVAMSTREAGPPRCGPPSSVARWLIEKVFVFHSHLDGAWMWISITSVCMRSRKMSKCNHRVHAYVVPSRPWRVACLPAPSAFLLISHFPHPLSPERANSRGAWVCGVDVARCSSCRLAHTFWHHYVNRLFNFKLDVLRQHF
jgi:hypothetical protein